MRDEPARPRRPWGRSLSLPPRVASGTWHVSLSSLSSSSMMSPAFRMTDDRAGGRLCVSGCPCRTPTTLSSPPQPDL